MAAWIDGSLIPVAYDVRSKESLQAAVSEIQKQAPFINLLVANSGYLGEVTNMAPRPPEQTVGQLRKGCGTRRPTKMQVKLLAPDGGMLSVCQSSY
jgi:NAD(P)-dependent dehydrogenase (short-subunit alcohol dehydrogenase family)